MKVTQLTYIKEVSIIGIMITSEYLKMWKNIKADFKNYRRIMCVFFQIAVLLLYLKMFNVSLVYGNVTV